jgi:hypothetical protein
MLGLMTCSAQHYDVVIALRTKPLVSQMVQLQAANGPTFLAISAFGQYAPSERQPMPAATIIAQCAIA